MMPLALGTQTGGSVIRPASFCGIHALKPTLGLISRRGVTLQSHTLDTVGVYGRSVADLALIAEAVAAHDPDDPVSYVRSRPGILATALAEPPVAPSFVFVRTPGWDEFAEPAAKEAIGELVEVLGDRCTMIETPTFAGAVEAQRIVQAAENAHYYGPLADAHPDGLSDELKARLAEGSRIGVRNYLDALAVREAAYGIVDDLCTDYSAILTLSAAGSAPAGYGNTGNPVFNGLWTFMGVPCVSLPLLEIDGMPLGVQLVGMRNDDGRLLRTARWLEMFVASAA
jgi:Asp-tRNA(Asn)/Glu-tRNA(Gln) amidotransferase A subunit family amidase